MRRRRVIAHPVIAQADSNALREPVVRHDELINCQDLAGRRGQLIIFNDHGRVVMVTAGGETAVLTPQQVGQLRAALRNAVLAPDQPTSRQTIRAERT